MRQHGSLLIDLNGVIAGLGLITLLAWIGAAEHRQLRQQEQRSADLDAAENILDACRHGSAVTLPRGWSCQRTPRTGAVLVSVRSPTMVLSSLLPANLPATTVP